jgi:hypothetical protein
VWVSVQATLHGVGDGGGWLAVVVAVVAWLRGELDVWWAGGWVMGEGKE